MSSPLAQVVAQLMAAIDQLDALAVRATRAAEDGAQANARYRDVGRGTDHPKLRAAVTQSHTAADKAHRLARLSSEASRHLSAYLDAISPGSTPKRADSGSGPPSGDELLTDSDRRDLDRAKVRGFLNRSARKADDLQDKTSKATEAVQQAVKVLRNPKGPSGTHTTGTATPTAQAAPPRPKIDGAEAAGNLVVVGLLAGVATHRIATVIGERIARFRGRERQRAQRPDSSPGES